MTVTHHLDGASHQDALSKVPEITLGFWVTKVLTTGMGETTSDFLVRTFDPPLAVAIVGALLAVLVGGQGFLAAIPPGDTGVSWC